MTRAEAHNIRLDWYDIRSSDVAKLIDDIYDSFENKKKDKQCKKK